MKTHAIINEMTIRGPNFDIAAQKFGQANSSGWLLNGEHIGDIEKFSVLKNGDFHSLWDAKTMIAFTSLRASKVDDVWVHPDYRGQRIFSKILWFFKTRLHHHILTLGAVHSGTMQELVVGMTRFKKSWVNINTKEVMSFSVDTLDDFYSWGGATEWRLMLENTIAFHDWPMFTEGKSFMKESYNEYIQ